MLNLYRRISIGKAALVALVASAAIVGYACGGGGGGNATGTATATAGGATETATSTSGENPTGSVTATASEQATPTSSANLPPAKGKVTYTYTDTDADGTVTSGTYTVYTDPPNIRSEGTAEGTFYVAIETADASYYCTDSGSAGQVCYLYPFDLDLSGLFLGYRDFVAEYQAEGGSLTHSTIAGTDAACFSATENGVLNELCVSADGLILVFNAPNPDEEGARMNMRATSYSTDVSASDFEPPYPVQTVEPTPAH